MQTAKSYRANCGESAGTCRNEILGQSDTAALSEVRQGSESESSHRFLLSMSLLPQLVLDADSANTKHIKAGEQDDLRIRAEQGK